MLIGIKLEGWLTIAAIILGPILAFVVQNWRDMRREARDRKLKIFRQLLLTLKVTMAPTHVDALNSIPLEFDSDKKIMEAWRLYTAHLGNSAMLKNNNRGWGEKRFQLLIDLVYTIAKSLGYDHLDKAMLENSIYVPQGYNDREEEFRQIRESLQQVLKGNHPIPVTMVGPIQVEEPIAPIEVFQAPPVSRPALPPSTVSAPPENTN
jgi:hypothetical protein